MNLQIVYLEADIKVCKKEKEREKERGKRTKCHSLKGI